MSVYWLVQAARVEIVRQAQNMINWEHKETSTDLCSKQFASSQTDTEHPEHLNTKHVEVSEQKLFNYLNKDKYVVAQTKKNKTFLIGFLV